MAVETVGNIDWLDIVVIAAYFVAVFAVGIWSSCKNRGSVGGYFLAGKSMHWLPVGASLFASNIGSGHFVGLAGTAASSGIGIAAFELSAIFILLLLGWVFAPVYTAAGVFTMPEYLRRRYGGKRIRIYLSVLSLILYIFTKISADLFAGYIFIHQSLKISLYPSIIGLVVIAALFTILGGLSAVIWTDFIQTIIMVVGSFILLGYGLAKVGGYEELVDKFFYAIPNTTRYSRVDDAYSDCGYVPESSMHLMRPYNDPTGLPWPGIFFGLTISSVWYWCSDQVIVQRVLSAKSITYSKAGTIVAGILKFLPFWIIIIPGMISRTLFPNEIACADPDTCMEVCDKRNGCTNIAYPHLVVQVLPRGLRGMMLAVMMSALLSSLTSIFNSASTIFTMDIWKRIRKNPSDAELLITGRLFVLALVGVSILWIPIVQGVPELFHYIQAITSFLGPPVCATYVLSIMWERTNEKGAFWGLMIGLVVGMVRFIWEYSYGVTPPCGDSSLDKRPAIIKDVHYLHFGIILFFISAFSTIAISLMTKPIDRKYIVRLTFFTRHSQEESFDISEIDETAKNEYDEKTDLTQVHEETEEKGSAKVDRKWYVKGFRWVCGIEDSQQSTLTDAEIKDMDIKARSIYEKPSESFAVNMGAITLATLTVFYWAFYG